MYSLSYAGASLSIKQDGCQFFLTADFESQNMTLPPKLAFFAIFAPILLTLNEEVLLYIT